MEELTGADYMTRPYIELRSHPDFDEDAWRVMTLIATMKTKEIKQIKLIGGNSNG